MRHGNAEIKLPGDISHYDVCVAEACEKSYDNLVDLEVFNEGIILHQVCRQLPFIIQKHFYDYRFANDIPPAASTHTLETY